MFTKVLIANRGAIATRIIRTLKKLNVQSVAVYSEADSYSLHVKQADEAFSLGEGAASDTYLDVDKILEIAQRTGAQAIHPGYGFLSENPDFVTRCEALGISFIGPSPEHMNLFGLKHTAREAAEKNNVPVLRGSNLLTSLGDALLAAGKIGYPVMLKSTAGGGGIGMQVCNDSDELQQNFESIKRLSANNFSNDGVFVEKYIAQARHIEVQVIGDGTGLAVALGERDCSAQRRHQKVIEETPAPHIPEDVRAQLLAAATNLLGSVKYKNAGTVEYIFDKATNEFYFLEVNTRLQVEHGVTEAVFGVDLVEWMLRVASEPDFNLGTARAALKPTGHAIQARIYAENPHKNFQPCAGLLSHVEFPEQNAHTRIDHWIESGIEVSPFFDPMLAKVICHSDNRENAINALDDALNKTTLFGIETNRAYIRNLLQNAVLLEGNLHTRFLDSYDFNPNTIDVISGGTLTTIQDSPGRVGYWDVGVPPSGPFDSLSFRLGNTLLGNDTECAGLEITLQGPTLKFNTEKTFVLTGADFAATLDDEPIAFYKTYTAKAGQTLKIGKPLAHGARAYLLFKDGLQANKYLGSCATFTLGQFGGFSGRSLRTGDVLNFPEKTTGEFEQQITPVIAESDKPQISNHWQLKVIVGPHGAPDFFTAKDLQTFFEAQWEIHYNSSRTGVRLIGPKPEWARDTGGEAGMHPSNIHDNAYAIGSVDFTGDMPVILGPDGPSLGGFVCPATVISSELWKLGQLKAGDKLQFIPVTLAQAKALEIAQEKLITLDDSLVTNTVTQSIADETYNPKVHDPIFHTTNSNGTDIVYRLAGDKYLLVEYGPLELDIAMRFRAHALMLELQKLDHPELLELTPGIRSLQIHYNSAKLSAEDLLQILLTAENTVANLEHPSVPSRIVHIPISWNDEACRLAIEKYQQSVRKDAPWCPDNIEFIRRINGLDSVDAVKKTVFDASYLVMGLGDVYLGAPVATPMDPRHRLVTTKYNPARTWTAENSVGIGGAYLCVYGMEGPGGYQFIGRTLQMWNKYHTTREFSKPWLLRFFDQIRFYEVSAEELLDIREKFPRGDYPLKIEECEFNLKEYQGFLEKNETDIASFSSMRQTAFNEELQRWKDSGQINFESAPAEINTEENTVLPDNCTAMESDVAGNIWQWQVAEGETVTQGQCICILESMKMEIELTAPCDGTLKSQNRQQGQQVHAGQLVGVIEHD